MAAVATAQVSIVPLQQEIQVNRGGKKRFQLQVANRGETPLSLSMNLYRMMITEEGLPVATSQPLDWSCAEWTTLTPAAFELGPNEVQTVEGVVTAPEDAAGSYYAFIAAGFRVPIEPFSFGQENQSQATVELGHGVSSVLMVTVRSSNNTATLVPDSLLLLPRAQSAPGLTYAEGAPPKSDVWQVVLSITNTGNIHTQATGEVAIWSEHARQVERADLRAGQGYILPGKKRVFRAEGTRPLNDGVYMIKVVMRTREGRMLQNSFPYSVINGEAIPGAASEMIRELVRASAPAFTLAQHQVHYEVTPGAKRTKGVRLTSYSRDTLRLTSSITNWTLNDSGKIELNPTFSYNARPCTGWVTVVPDTIVLPPRRSATAKIVVQAPEELDGEYFAGVVFNPPGTRDDLPTELRMARTVLLTATSMQNAKYEAVIESIQTEPVSDLMRVFIVNVGNTGNVHCFADGRLEIYDRSLNLAMDPVSFGGAQDYILPARTRGYAVPCPGQLAPGTYEVIASVQFADGVRPVIAKIKYQVPGS
jgi:hypothetical protein